MSSAKDLKDAYISGVLDSLGPDTSQALGREALVELGNKLGTEQSKAAGTLIDLDNKTAYSVNDGNPRVVVTDGDRMGVTLSPGIHGHPILNSGIDVNMPEGMTTQRFVDDAGEDAAMELIYGLDDQARNRSERNTVQGASTHDRYKDAMTKPYTERRHQVMRTTD